MTQLSQVAKSHDLEYDEEKGISDIATLNSRLNVVNLRLMDKDIRFWAETEEQCQRMAIKLGIFGPEENHRQPFSRESMRRYIRETTVNKFSGDNDAHTKENGKVPTDAASSPNVGVIPYECNPGGKCNAEDPRSKFGDEYELLCAWVAKPRSVPAFADPRSSSDSPTHSWSRSPAKARSEAPVKRSMDNKDASDIRDDKSGFNAERSALERAKSLHPANGGYGESHNMELEEGYFRVMLLNGDPALLQYGEIVDLIRGGQLPDGWSAYRESDKLWISVYEAQASDEAAPMEVYGRGVGERDRQAYEKRKVGAITLAREAQAAGPLREEFSRAALVAKDALGSDAPASSAPMALRKKYVRKPSSSGAAPLSSDFSQAARAASNDLAAYDRVLALRAGAKLLCGAPKSVDPSVRAMIKEKVIEDRGRLRDIASGALQKALRLYIQRRRYSVT